MSSSVNAAGVLARFVSRHYPISGIAAFAQLMVTVSLLSRLIELYGTLGLPPELALADLNRAIVAAVDAKEEEK